MLGYVKGWVVFDEVCCCGLKVNQLFTNQDWVVVNSFLCPLGNLRLPPSSTSFFFKELEDPLMYLQPQSHPRMEDEGQRTKEMCAVVGLCVGCFGKCPQLTPQSTGWHSLWTVAINYEKEVTIVWNHLLCSYTTCVCRVGLILQCSFELFCLWRGNLQWLSLLRIKLLYVQLQPDICDLGTSRMLFSSFRMFHRAVRPVQAKPLLLYSVISWSYVIMF